MAACEMPEQDSTIGCEAGSLAVLLLLRLRSQIDKGKCVVYVEHSY
jgi:hypothetical protein